MNRPVDPTVNNYLPLRIAILNCDTYNNSIDYEIFELLINDYRMNISNYPSISNLVTDWMNQSRFVNNEMPPLIPIDNIYLSPREGRTDEQDHITLD